MTTTISWSSLLPRENQFSSKCTGEDPLQSSTPPSGRKLTQFLRLSTPEPKVETQGHTSEEKRNLDEDLEDETKESCLHYDLTSSSNDEISSVDNDV
ncbi:hypothetical protein RRG08_055430 [Elysia crispata]|uniref:Uncharacterized protein n=1 Tax=Elysia crispata TaxID=231223 RepID=A0AAE1AQU2_9GAST|nr:hypothetical protein RRG08_055430 [Elysia crispata]